MAMLKRAAFPTVLHLRRLPPPLPVSYDQPDATYAPLPSLCVSPPSSALVLLPGVRYGRASWVHTLLTLGTPHQSIENYPLGRAEVGGQGKSATLLVTLWPCLLLWNHPLRLQQHNVVLPCQPSPVPCFISLLFALPTGSITHPPLFNLPHRSR